MLQSVNHPLTGMTATASAATALATIQGVSTPASRRPSTNAGGTAIAMALATTTTSPIAVYAESKVLMDGELANRITRL
ncbi:MAG TPA: hypothetical protein VNG04_06615 [Candidatus Acidoferrum sp.]|nr:hypothetical protein [Candidatus Acidoferrum sp.]